MDEGTRGKMDLNAKETMVKEPEGRQSVFAAANVGNDQNNRVDLVKCLLFRVILCYIWKFCLCFNSHVLSGLLSQVCYCFYSRMYFICASLSTPSLCISTPLFLSSCTRLSLLLPKMSTALFPCKSLAFVPRLLSWPVSLNSTLACWFDLPALTHFLIIQL